MYEFTGTRLPSQRPAERLRVQGRSAARTIFSLNCPDNFNHKKLFMEQNLIRQIRILQIYAIFLTIVIATLVTLFFRQNTLPNPTDKKQHFKEIDAERINIIDSNGSIRMGISNPNRQHPGAMNGKNFDARERPAGMIFFNDEGDECGGLVYDGNKKEAGFTYSIDQYKNDQIMQWQYDQDNSTQQRVRSYGLKMWDR